MNWLIYTLGAIWFAGLIFFAARALNYTRMVLNNLVPGVSYWSSDTLRHLSPAWLEFRIEVELVDPAHLTDVGKLHRSAAIRNRRIMTAWAAIGFIMMVDFSYYIRR